MKSRQYSISQQEARERIIIKRHLRKLGIPYQMEESTKILLDKLNAKAALANGFSTPSTLDRRANKRQLGLPGLHSLHSHISNVTPYGRLLLGCYSPNNMISQTVTSSQIKCKEGS